MNPKITNEYKVVVAKVPVRGGYIERINITKNYIPLYEINKWLESRERLTTARKYAYIMVSYLKYLDSLGMKYRDVTTNKVLKGYVKYLLHYDEGNLKVVYKEPLRSIKTVESYTRTVQQFYKWLEGEVGSRDMYALVWDYDFRPETNKEQYYKENKEYIKWYTDNQIEVLTSNFNSIRDKVIFLITIEGGCRIGEVLTMRYSDYDGIEGTIYISESKTRKRIVNLSNELCREIDRYIMTERKDVEVELGLIDYLFVNIKRGDSFGKPLTYSNYYRILKNTAERAGFDARKIITHSGRSTKAQELIEHQILYPEDGLTDTYIMDIMGWSSMESLKPYKKELGNKAKKAVLEKVEIRKKEKEREEKE